MYLGIDTSNYTTSAALADENGRIVANCKRPLPVKAGECGLRQSDAVFAHIKNLPSLMKEIEEELNGRRLSAIGVSEKPRACEGSYMPCFLSGVAAASAAAASSGVPLYRFSHQCGHLAAALYSSGGEGLYSRPFGAFHVSGGTTEVLFCRYNEELGGFTAEIVGESADLHAGQVIDRIGVYLGLPFPAGRPMEELAEQCAAPVKNIRVSVKGLRANLSGLENLAKKLYETEKDAPLCAAYVLDYVGKTLARLTENLLAEKGNIPIVYAGGVMSNKRIRRMLAPLSDSRFAEPAFSADNAAGIALLCRRRHLSLR